MIGSHFFVGASFVKILAPATLSFALKITEREKQKKIFAIKYKECSLRGVWRG